MGRYSNLRDQGERIHNLSEIVPEGSSEVNPGTLKQVQRRLRPDEIDDLVRQYQAGVNVQELAVSFGIHRDTVSETLTRQGVARRKRGIPSETLDEVIGDYRAGLSLASIGARLSVDPGTVASALRRAGVELRRRRGWDLLGHVVRGPAGGPY
jgi:DNA-directed RNA polymerase specialized sigma24 family protein